ncbi:MULTISPECIES: DUF3953 domain-containing protein [Niallia]|uniref:DUF3953 domain-containing protein n=1 Tax=Niallia TaxID=2837506 RepID=UPI001ED9E0A4|nr:MULTISPECIES: DUF3953 domain-containing protein [Niallia]MED4041176.1 DUF3953 domain-containing protein [Niallia taxi]UPO91043.1 DUF3953 domain-containing protein [Niallia sp. Man26]
MSGGLKVVFAIFAALLALIGTVTGSTLILALMFLFLGLLFLVIGFTEIMKERKIAPVIMLLLGGFYIIGSIFILLFET